jgi:glycerol-3-phosphate cytidylyltransferase
LQTDPTIDRPDTKNTPVQSIFERYEQLKACRYVDEVLVYATEKDLIDILLSYPIDVRILGEEYEHKEFTGREECISRGIKFYFNKREHTFSTTELRQRVVDAEADKLLKQRIK